MMPCRSALAAALPLALVLSACGQGKDSAEQKASGEILPGSASDAMLPLDTVRSQAPLAPKAKASAGADEGEGDPGAAPTEEAGAEAGASPAAAEPTPPEPEKPE